MMTVWVVLYVHISGAIVVGGVYEDEQEAETIVSSLKSRSAVARAWKTSESVYYAARD